MALQINRLSVKKAWLFGVLVLLATCLPALLNAQRFAASVFAGLNMAQIDGDYSYGYNSPGLQCGISGITYLTDNTELRIGLAYSQRGSMSRFLAFNAPEILRIRLHYMEIPVTFHVKDWYTEEGYYKIHYFAGLAYSRLFDYTVQDGGLGVAREGYRTNDISWTAGALFYLSPRWSVQLRYTRSATLLYNRNKVPGSVHPSMRSYFLNLSLFYDL